MEKIDAIIAKTKQRRHADWQWLQTNSPETARFMADFAKVFGKPANAVVKINGETRRLK